ncbi:hypothetical protein K470DRAFT_110129 [Piedraia hortae CBS 480.64]|uniref:Uncharacterized protein n=1 Tax=Piedraia hortae CBS 480.64 TaxID=1314780 RepID=A0A6A7BXC8_9PEZI|nr:hypothetical protein K470DRAFT_110129 [Piedraia hortae CBS 480.64]
MGNWRKLVAFLSCAVEDVSERKRDEEQAKPPLKRLAPARQYTDDKYLEAKPPNQTCVENFSRPLSRPASTASLRWEGLQPQASHKRSYSNLSLLNLYVDELDELQKPERRPSRPSMEHPIQRKKRSSFVQGSTERPILKRMRSSPSADYMSKVDQKISELNAIIERRRACNRTPSADQVTRLHTHTSTADLGMHSDRRKRSSQYSLRRSESTSFIERPKMRTSRVEAEVSSLNVIVERRRQASARLPLIEQHVPAIAPTLKLSARSQTLTDIGSAFARPYTALETEEPSLWIDDDERPDSASTDATVTAPEPLNLFPPDYLWADSRLPSWGSHHPLGYDEKCIDENWPLGVVQVRDD